MHQQYVDICQKAIHVTESGLVSLSPDKTRWTGDLAFLNALFFGGSEHGLAMPVPFSLTFVSSSPLDWPGSLVVF